MISNSIFESIVDLFFMSPDLEPKAYHTFGNLHLLRRDLSVCLGINPNDGSIMSQRALFSGTMTLMTGIDLLGQLYVATEHKDKVGFRFRSFIKNYFELSGSESELVYELRNALLHSFGLYSRDEHKNKEYWFHLVFESGELIKKLGESMFEIDTLTLWNDFEKAVSQYRFDLLDDPQLRDNFLDSHPNYVLYYYGNGGS